jgi:hypothetical protein
VARAADAYQCPVPTQPGLARQQEPAGQLQVPGYRILRELARRAKVALSTLRHTVGEQESIRNHFLFESLAGHLEPAKH